jgi:hypothetical protein
MSELIVGRGPNLGDLELARERSAEEAAECRRRVAIYAAWVAEHGRIGEDQAGVIVGTAAPPRLDEEGRKRLAQQFDRPSTRQPPCGECGERPAALTGDDGLCSTCRHRDRERERGRARSQAKRMQKADHAKAAQVARPRPLPPPMPMCGCGLVPQTRGTDDGLCWACRARRAVV